MTPLEAYNLLTQKEKEALNILSINMMNFYLKHERPSAIDLIKRIKKVKLTYKFLDEIIEKRQLAKLKNEIARIKREKKQNIDT